VILDVVAVRVAVERCVKEGGFSPGEVHLGIAGLRAITREVEMPLVPDSEIDAAVRLQALDVIPFAIDKALISARALEESVGPNGLPVRRVLVAAAHRDLVDPLIQIVTAAGLTPVSIEPTSSIRRPRSMALRRSSRSVPDSPRWPFMRTGFPISFGRLQKAATWSPRRSPEHLAYRSRMPKR
jgi:Tfp pilus assembly PilM family ATPase